MEIFWDGKLVWRIWLENYSSNKNPGRKIRKAIFTTECWNLPYNPSRRRSKLIKWIVVGEKNSLSEERTVSSESLLLRLYYYLINFDFSSDLELTEMFKLAFKKYITHSISKSESSDGIFFSSAFCCFSLYW
jgi:hypothetical protein